MNIIVKTPIGGEVAAIEEVKDLIDKKAIQEEGQISFSLSNEEELFEYCFFTQAALQVLVEFTKEWLKEGMSFRIRAQTQEIEAEEGSKLNSQGKFKVDLNNPQLPLIIHKEKLYIDFTGDISKRDFRVFTHRQTIKGPVAFCFLKLSGYTGKESLLDPFSRDGTIVLEAAHYALKKSVREFDWEKMNFTHFPKFEDIDFETFFEKFKPKDEKLPIWGLSSEFRDVNAAKKNSRIAKVTINFSRVDSDWVDVKFEKNQFDLLIAHPPRLSEKAFDEFIKAAKIISKKIVLLENPKEGRRSLFSGKDEKGIWVLKK